MNEQFRNKVVLIENEEQLQKARDIIESNGQRVIRLWFKFSDKKHNYLQYAFTAEGWNLDVKYDTDTEITLSEFEELFNEK